MFVSLVNGSVLSHNPQFYLMHMGSSLKNEEATLFMRGGFFILTGLYQIISKASP